MISILRAYANMFIENSSALVHSILMLRVATRFASNSIWKDIKITYRHTIQSVHHVAYILHIPSRSLSLAHIKSYDTFITIAFYIT